MICVRLEDMPQMADRPDRPIVGAKIGTPRHGDLCQPRTLPPLAPLPLAPLAVPVRTVGGRLLLAPLLLGPNLHLDVEHYKFHQLRKRGGHG